MRRTLSASQNSATWAAALCLRLVLLTLLPAAAGALCSDKSAAAPLGQGAWTIPAAKEQSPLIQKAFRGGRGAAFRGGGAWRGRGAVVRRGGAVAYRGAAVRRGGAWAYRGGAAVRRGGAVVWRRPASYWWPAGGAIAAGAAIGVVSAATAAAWAGRPPVPGYCWYYTDPSRRQGFWDVCR
jgi:hypothetical protein